MKRRAGKDAGSSLFYLYCEGTERLCLEILSGKYSNRSRTKDKSTVNTRILTIRVAVTSVLISIGIDA